MNFVKPKANAFEFSARTPQEEKQKKKETKLKTCVPIF
jgi:hypothetical protein